MQHSCIHLGGTFSMQEDLEPALIRIRVQKVYKVQTIEFGPGA